MPNSPHQGEVQAALDALRGRPEGFVIIEHAETQDFVQFASTDAGGLLFDAPAQALEGDAFEAALAFFEARDLGGPKSYATLDPTTGREVEEQTSFQTEFQDPARAAAFALAFLADVFGHGGAFPILVTAE